MLIVDAANQIQQAPEIIATENTEDESAEKSVQLLATAQWYRGLALAERLANLTELDSNLQNLNLEKAKAKLARWKEQAPFNRPNEKNNLFAERLASENLTETQLLYLLAEPVEILAARQKQAPQWLTSLKTAFANYNATENGGLKADKTKTFGQLLTALNPVIEQGLALLRAEIALLTIKYNKTGLPFDPANLLDLLTLNLPGLLLPKISRVLVLELNVARVQGKLQGANAEERFADFVAQLNQPGGILAILEEYPVLAQQIVNTIDTWVNVTLEFLQRLCADWVEICALFSPDQNPGVLLELDGGAGDLHRGGRSVYRLTFSSGFRLVYKPKSLAVDQHFQELLAWLNQHGAQPAFRLISLLDRRTYGWTEFITATGCETAEEVARFYVRQGGYLALLYALEATDFHAENLIAAGEHPVLIDLEALFHPRMPENAEAKAANLAADNLGFSVLRVGLLPQRSWLNEESQGIDLSGLGGKGGQLTPQAVPTWQGLGTDELKLVRQRMPIMGSNNRPVLKGATAEIDVLEYTEQIVQGFQQIYQLLIDHKEELIAGPLQAFADDEIRLILRATRIYGQMLDESFHPDLLRDALERERFLDYLWLSVEKQYSLKQFVPAEKRDLLAGDIPMFTTKPGSRAIFDSRGNITPDFLGETSLEAVSRHIRQLNSADLSRQLWFVQASLATLAFSLSQFTKRYIQYVPTKKLATPPELIEAARAVGQRLTDLALIGEEDASWLGLTPINEVDCALMPAGMDLYSGTPGIALFLAYLGNITRQANFTDLAKLALAGIERQLETYQQGRPAIGAFDGLGGIIYLFTHLGVLWQDSTFFERATALVEPIASLIEKDEALDIIAGVAGTILSLVSLYKVAPQPRILEVAIQCGDHLTRTAEASGEHKGIAWKSKMASKVPLTGFSHGAAGMGYSLLELAALTGEARFAQTALQAFAYERSVFSVEHNNWPDYREFNDIKIGSSGSPAEENPAEAAYVTLWCHGAPGIGLGRLASLSHLVGGEADLVREEIETAIQITLEKGFGRNHSICHGDLGNLELLLLASRKLEGAENENLTRLVANRAAMILDSIEKTGWIAGIPLGVETVGLMTGLAGMGYELLRLAKPEQVPSILLLQAPYQNLAGL